MCVPLKACDPYILVTLWGEFRVFCFRLATGNECVELHFCVSLPVSLLRLTSAFLLVAIQQYFLLFPAFCFFLRLRPTFMLPFLCLIPFIFLSFSFLCLSPRSPFYSLLFLSASSSFYSTILSAQCHCTNFAILLLLSLHRSASASLAAEAEDVRPCLTAGTETLPLVRSDS